MKKNKLQNLFNKLSGTDEAELSGFKAFDDAVSTLKGNLKQSIKVSTVDEVNTTLKKFQQRIDINPLIVAFDQLKTEITEREAERESVYKEELDSKMGELSQKLAENQGNNETTLTQILEEGSLLQSQIAKIGSRKPPEIPDFTAPMKDLEKRMMAVIAQVETNIKSSDKSEELKTLITGLEESLKKLRSEMATRGGGSMNRQIFVGNTNPLTRYTDINVKAGANVTLTYANNDTTKKVDITVAATGGGGTIRSINSVSTNTNAGATAGTDYVYLCTGTMTITLPTAAANTNLYTVKNVGTGVVTVATTGGQTIDGSVSISLFVQYTAVDLISDTSNWNVT